MTEVSSSVAVEWQKGSLIYTKSLDYANEGSSFTCCGGVAKGVTWENVCTCPLERLRSKFSYGVH